MKDWVLHYWGNPWIALLLYWFPLAICTVGYIVRTWRNVRKDLRNRVTKANYYPTDTIGTLIGRGLVTIIPIANLCAAAFDLAPEGLGNFIKGLGKIFDQPLVPVKKAQE